MTVSVRAEDVAENLAAVRDRIAAAGGDPEAITIVAVTKDQPREVIPAALAAGLVDLGENRAEALVAAASEHAAARWHYLAPIQRNKIARLAPHVAVWQTVDREAAAVAVTRHSPQSRMLVQVNLTQDANRGGCALKEVAPLVEKLRAQSVAVLGLMAVGPLGPPSASREGFRAVCDLADVLDLPVRSLGMSGDLEVAVQAGSTMVRIGASLFGPRPGADGARH
ncbi:MAG TPA: alanine racemase [Acidimicrobiales bacterium]|nr:alanine racemase [Acidimicrobiales bacterium]